MIAKGEIPNGNGCQGNSSEEKVGQRQRKRVKGTWVEKKHGKEDGLKALEKRMTLRVKVNKMRQSVGKEKETGWTNTQRILHSFSLEWVMSLLFWKGLLFWKRVPGFSCVPSRQMVFPALTPLVRCRRQCVKQRFWIQNALEFPKCQEFVDARLGCSFAALLPAFCGGVERKFKKSRLILCEATCNAVMVLKNKSRNSPIISL